VSSTTVTSFTDGNFIHLATNSYGDYFLNALVFCIVWFISCRISNDVIAAGVVMCVRRTLRSCVGLSNATTGYNQEDCEWQDMDGLKKKTHKKPRDKIGKID